MKKTFGQRTTQTDLPPSDSPAPQTDSATRQRLLDELAEQAREGGKREWVKLAAEVQAWLGDDRQRHWSEEKIDGSAVVSVVVIGVTQ